ncbi:MAG: 50S ribosomal protein L25 [Armatimonadetes bacterium]|nr:50S ribosomal protein L25 [Armatimonadota bacterium]
MAQVSLECKRRENSGKGVARKLRAAGRIPGVLYGANMDPVKIDLDQKAVHNLLRKYGLNPIITLSIEGAGNGEGQQVCMIADYQRDVFQRNLLHVDLRKVDLSEKITKMVPIRIHGEVEVRVRGGILEMRIDHIEVRSLPLDIPPAFDLDISKCKTGDQMRVSDIPIPPKVEVLHEPEEVVLSIASPRKGTETAGEEGAEGAAPAAE